MFRRFTLRKGKTLLKAIRSGGLWSYFSFMRHHLKKASQSFLRSFYQEMKEVDFLAPLDPKQRRVLEGLHQLISQHEFSVVIYASQGNLDALKRTLLSVFSQTTSKLEVILFVEEEDQNLKELFPKLKFNVDPKGDYVLTLYEGEALRADALYRYEQLIVSKPEINALYAETVELDNRGRLLPGTLYRTPKTLHFPYEFQAKEVSALLVKAPFWESKLSLEKLDLKGVVPIIVPLPLIARANLDQQRDLLSEKQHYFKEKGLDWQLVPGLLSETIRAIPALEGVPMIQVIIPFKDMKELTLKAAASALASKGVEVHITVVDNGSEDLSVAKELKDLGCEVIRVEEPFNYSRLNNIGVRSTSNPFPLICFLNNDAILEPDALLEMSRWANLPDLGLIGCRLHYPNGLIQHAGVHIEPENAYPGSVCWSHIEMKERFEKTRFAKMLHVPDAVTAAAALVQRSKFEKVGGFDELLYPVAYSDTDLCRRLNQHGFKPFYTPYAVGTHHESLSREPGFLEDFDRSLFLEQFSRGS